MDRKLNRLVVSLSLAVLVVVCVAVPAAASLRPRVGPNQHFVGLVNNSTGTPNPAVIQMACFGPIVPGETGHPFAGQTLVVQRVSPATARAGFTGANATQISVFFNAPPPSPTSGSGAVTFTRYGVTLAIPTSVTLPCAGSGDVFFVPLPPSPPTSISFTVPVNFLGQP
jgi:hypothetical protein